MSELERAEQELAFARAAAEGRTGVSKAIDAETLPGITYYDSASNRFMRYVYPDAGHWSAGWIVVKNPSGEWMTLRKADDGDIQAINAAVVDAHHSVSVTTDHPDTVRLRFYLEVLMRGQETLAGWRDSIDALMKDPYWKAAIDTASERKEVKRG